MAKTKAAKRGKDAYAHEKMTLADAISVLRVSFAITARSVSLTYRVPARQAVEVARPNSTYELVIRTAMSRGAPIPTGRINLPREAKPRKEYRILVFADGRQADEAKKAGAHVVGGLELVDAVCSFVLPLFFILRINHRSRKANTTAARLFFAHHHLSVASVANSVVSWVPVVSCLPRDEAPSRMISRGIFKSYKEQPSGGVTKQEQ